MPEQNILVRIEANAQQLRSELQSARTGVDQLGNTTQQRTQQMGQSIQRAGIAMATMGAAALAAGTQIVRMAGEFETNMAQIQGLVGIAADEVDRMGQSVMGLASATATGPGELSDALFTITSAGLRGADAMDALESAARLSAAGMGTTREVATALTGVMNAYASSGITAAEASDFLAGTARAGNFEVSELGGAIGRVLPMASATGVALSDVGGAIALVTRNGGSASEAVTQVAGVMRGLMIPTGSAASALEEMGLSADEVGRVVREDGLVAALQMLWQATGENVARFSELVGGSEAAGAALTIVNADAETIAGTFGLVADSAGIADEAFAAVEQTAAFRLRQAMINIQTSLTQVGLVVADIVVPALERMAGMVQTAADIWLSLPPGIQSFTVSVLSVLGPLGLMTALLGRNLVAVVALIPRMADAGRAAISFGSALGTSLHPALIAVAVAVAAGVIVYQAHQRAAQEARDRANELTEALNTQEQSLPAVVASMQELADSLLEVSAAAGTTGEEMGDVAAETAVFLERLDNMGTDGGREAFDTLRLSVEELLPVMQSGTDDFERLQEAIENNTGRGIRAAESFSRTRAEIMDLNLANEDLIIGWLNQAEAAGVSIDALSDMADVFDEQSDAYDDITREQREFALAAVRTAVEADALSEAQARTARENITAATTFGDLLAVVLPVRAALEAQAEAAGVGADATEDADAAIEGMIGSTEQLGGALEGSSAAASEWAEEIRQSIEGGELFADVLGRIEALASDVDAVLNQLTGTQQSLDAANADLADGWRDLEGTIEANGEAVRGMGDDLTETRLLATEAGSAVLGAFRDQAGAIRESTEALALSGASRREVLGHQRENIRMLRSEMEAMGLHENLIQATINTYARVPPEVVTAMTVEAQQANADAEALIQQMIDYGALNPEAFMSANPQAALDAMGAVLTEMAGYDDTTAEAALDADSLGFDRAFAQALLELTGFDAEQAIAQLDGNVGPLQDALNEGMIQLGIIDAETATPTVTADTAAAEADLTGVDNHLAELASTTSTPTVDADTVAASVALSGVSDDLTEIDTRTTVAEVDVEADQAGVANTRSEIDGVADPPGRRVAAIYATVVGASQSSTRRTLDQLAADRQAALNVVLGNLQYVWNTLAQLTQTRYATIIVRTTSGYANGGINEAYANGGVRSPRPAAHITHSPRVLYGEPETGGEAFIPLGRNKRGTALPVLATAANRMGFGLTRMADGGILGAGGTAAREDMLDGIEAAVAAGAERGVMRGMSMGGSSDGENSNRPGGRSVADSIMSLAQEVRGQRRPEGSTLFEDGTGSLPDGTPFYIPGVNEPTSDEYVEAPQWAVDAYTEQAGPGGAWEGAPLPVTVESMPSAQVPALAPFEDRLEGILAGTYEFAVEQAAGTGGGPTTAASGGSGSFYNGLGEEQVELERTTSGLANGLQEQLASLGIMPEAINEISAEVARLPRRTQMQLVMQAQEAQDDGEAMTRLLQQLGQMTVEPLMEVDITQPRHDIGQAMLDLAGFDSREARAALRANSQHFDEELARTTLSLTGYDDTEVQALLDGDNTGLQAALDEALVALGLFRGAADDVLDPLGGGAAPRPELDTGSQRMDNLGLNLQELGLTNEAIEDILRNVQRMPRQRQMRLLLDSEAALTDSTVLAGLLGRFDGMTSEAVMGLEGTEDIRRGVGQALLEIEDINGREAVARLNSRSDDFDRDLAQTVLELNGFNDEEAAAILAGNPARLQQSLDDAIIDLGLFGRTREDATIGAETDNPSLERARRRLGNLADPLSGQGNPHGRRGRAAVFAALTDAASANATNANLNQIARPRTATVFVRTVRQFADGGINGDIMPAPRGTGVPRRAPGSASNGSNGGTSVTMHVVPERLVPSLSRVMRQAGSGPVPSGPVRESML